MWPFLGALALLGVLAALLGGELAFERGRRTVKPPKQLPPPP